MKTSQSSAVLNDEIIALIHDRGLADRLAAEVRRETEVKRAGVLAELAELRTREAAFCASVPQRRAKANADIKKARADLAAAEQELRAADEEASAIGSAIERCLFKARQAADPRIHDCLRMLENLASIARNGFSSRSILTGKGFLGEKITGVVSNAALIDSAHGVIQAGREACEALLVAPVPEDLDAQLAEILESAKVAVRSVTQRVG